MARIRVYPTTRVLGCGAIKMTSAPRRHVEEAVEVIVEQLGRV